MRDVRVAERVLRFPVGAETRMWTVRGTVPIDRPAPTTVSTWGRSVEAAPLLRRWFAGGGVRLALLDDGSIRAVLPAGTDWPTGLQESDIGAWRTVPADSDAADGPVRQRHLASRRLPAHPQLRLVVLTEADMPALSAIAFEAIRDRPALALVPGVAILAGLAGLVWGLARREPRHRQAKPRLVRRGPREAPEDAPLLVADFDNPDSDDEGPGDVMAGIPRVTGRTGDKTPVYPAPDRESNVLRLRAFYRSEAGGFRDLRTRVRSGVLQELLRRVSDAERSDEDPDHV